MRGRTPARLTARRRTTRGARRRQSRPWFPPPRSHCGTGRAVQVRQLLSAAHSLRSSTAVASVVYNNQPGWTDRDRQQPVGDTGHYEPRHTDAIVAAELHRALDDPDPLRGIAQLTARWAAAFVLNPDGITRTKTLGTERMARKLQDALPGGENPLRTAVWEFIRPMLSPNLAQINRDAFVDDTALESTVALNLHRSESNLDELDLGEEADAPAA